jgi:hypothetical protein
MPKADRDRDGAGRARNDRPRDGLGRPLPRGAAGEPTIPEDLRLPPDEGVALAQDLLDAGRPFHAHEVLEALWKAEPDPARRQVWQALAQVAVGLTHEARGNTAGAQRLVARGRDGLAARAVDPAEVDAAGVLAWADRWLGGERSGPPRLDGRVGPLS